MNNPAELADWLRDAADAQRAEYERLSADPDADRSSVWYAMGAAHALSEAARAAAGNAEATFRPATL